MLVHGTFANPGFLNEVNDVPAVGAEPIWWRLTGHGADETTADRLQNALEGIDPGLAETVWHPGQDPRDGELTYREVGEWTGANTHKARLVAARNLAQSLEQIAQGRECTAENPLLVNFVAHSHGGNVVLETLNHLGDTVQARQVCMLGTPLTWRFVDPRVLYLGYILFFFVATVIAGAQGFVEGLSEGDDGLTGLGLVIMAIVGYALILPFFLWLGVAAISLGRSISGLSSGKPAYGPKPAALEQALRGRPAVLFISPEDEADLMLQLGAAPLDAYRALVRGQPSLEGVEGFVGRSMRRLLRYIELAYVRPFSYVMAIPVVEIALERFGLGFPLLSVLFHNYEMVTWTGAKTYADDQIVTSAVGAEDLKARVLNVSLGERKVPVAPKVSTRPGTRQDAERIEALREVLVSTLGGLREQIQLRHSGYYESQHIIEHVAEAIAAPHPGRLGGARPGTPGSASVGFSEGDDFDTGCPGHDQEVLLVVSDQGLLDLFEHERRPAVVEPLPHLDSWRRWLRRGPWPRRGYRPPG